MKSKAGKGSSPRNCFSDNYRKNYDEIFRSVKSETIVQKGQYEVFQELFRRRYMQFLRNSVKWNRVKGKKMSKAQAKVIESLVYP
jgi:glutathione peroxidase-family protein